jgi:uncharacterized protein YutE (UPF0331/DUF86 family)
MDQWLASHIEHRLILSYGFRWDYCKTFLAGFKERFLGEGATCANAFGNSKMLNEELVSLKALLSLETTLDLDVVQVATRRREDLKFFSKSAVFVFKFRVLNLGRDDGRYFPED